MAWAVDLARKVDVSEEVAMSARGCWAYEQFVTAFKEGRIVGKGVKARESWRAYLKQKLSEIGMTNES